MSPHSFFWYCHCWGSYSLQCTVTVTGSIDQPIITWLMGPMDNQITSGVVTTVSMSTLTFNPLAASHAGIYTCRATLGSAMDSASRAITVQSESIEYKLRFYCVCVFPSAGSYTCTCQAVVASSLLSDPIIDITSTAASVDVQLTCTFLLEFYYSKFCLVPRPTAIRVSVNLS
jgi:hypothetical protein